MTDGTKRTQKTYGGAVRLFEESQVNEVSKMTDAMKRANKIYEVVVRLIEESQVEEAISKLAEIEDKIGELHLLNKLANELIFALGREYGLARRLDMRDVHVLRSADSLGRELDSTLLRASSIVYAFSSPDANDTANELFRANNSPSDLIDLHARAYTLARELADTLANTDTPARIKNLNSVILGVLERENFENWIGKWTDPDKQRLF